MKLGDIGVVVGGSSYAGYVVVRTALGLLITSKLYDVWSGPPPTFSVRLLQPGDFHHEKCRNDRLIFVGIPGPGLSISKTPGNLDVSAETLKSNGGIPTDETSQIQETEMHYNCGCTATGRSLSTYCPEHEMFPEHINPGKAVITSIGQYSSIARSSGGVFTRFMTQNHGESWKGFTGRVNEKTLDECRAYPTNKITVTWTDGDGRQCVENIGPGFRTPFGRWVPSQTPHRNLERFVATRAEMQKVLNTIIDLADEPEFSKHLAVGGYKVNCGALENYRPGDKVVFFEKTSKYPASHGEENIENPTTDVAGPADKPSVDMDKTPIHDEGGHILPIHDSLWMCDEFQLAGAQTGRFIGDPNFTEQTKCSRLHPKGYICIRGDKHVGPCALKLTDAGRWLWVPNGPVKRCSIESDCSWTGARLNGPRKPSKPGDVREPEPEQKSNYLTLLVRRAYSAVTRRDEIDAALKTAKKFEKMWERSEKRCWELDDRNTALLTRAIESERNLRIKHAAIEILQKEATQQSSLAGQRYSLLEQAPMIDMAYEVASLQKLSNPYAYVNPATFDKIIKGPHAAYVEFLPVDGTYRISGSPTTWVATNLMPPNKMILSSTLLWSLPHKSRSSVDRS